MGQIAISVNLREPVYTAPVLAANAANYTPAGSSLDSQGSQLWLLSASVPVSLSGLAGGTQAKVLTLLNIGANNITLINEGGASLPANRFKFGLILQPGQSVTMQYSTNLSGWIAQASNMFVGTGWDLRTNGDVAISTTNSVDIETTLESVNLISPTIQFSVTFDGFIAISPLPGDFANDAAAAAAGVPVTALYRNGSALMIRAA